MGPVIVKYKAQRGPHAPGDVVKDPKDWFNQVIEEEFDLFKRLYDEASPEKKSRIAALFPDNQNVLEDQNYAGMWLAEHEADPEKLVRFKASIEEIMAQ